jgi:hypothetical protein
VILEGVVVYQPDEAMAERLAEMVGLPTSAKNGTSMLFGAVTFALNSEEPLLAVFTAPAVARTGSGPGRLVAVTRTRVVEATAVLTGEWGLNVSRHSGTDVALAVKPLAGFDGVRVSRGSWSHSESQSADNVLFLTSVGLMCSEGEPFILWAPEQEWLRYHDQDVLLNGLRALLSVIGGTGIPAS